MLRVLDLILRISKYCLVLTLVRLVSTAFGWEFGVSRQYLRLLEWILQLGQERIERCESEQRLANGNSKQSISELGQDKDDFSKRNGIVPPCELDLPENKENGEQSQECTTRKRRVGITFNEADLNRRHQNGFNGKGFSKDDFSTGRGKNTYSDLQIKKRRVSTPDGPPVFLLDDDEDDGDMVCESSSNLASGHSQATGQREELCVHKKHEFHWEDPAKLVVRGISAIIDDEVTKRFTPEELKTWNLLTRTNAKNYQFMSRSLGLCWFAGLIIRYAILMPLRILFTVTGFLWLISTMSLIGLLPRRLRGPPYYLTSLMSFRMLSCGITSRLKFHNRQWRAQKGDICVANHTSPIDVVLLACDNCYALVGQRHGGLLGILEIALSRATNHVWFDRSETSDRKMVTKKLSEHVAYKSNLPVLIFPEGTCINNSAVMRFSKGIFGLKSTVRVCPVAIKYDPRFGDPFWCSSKQSYLQYLLMMMSSWAIKCDVWYLPPMERLEGESPAEFADRVKSEIAKQGGLEDLAWDGQLKRSSVKPTWLHQQQEDYVKRLKID